VLETVRSSFWPYARAEGFRLHRDFHHLNSSQAFAFNLFFPFARSKQTDCTLLLDALGLAREAIDECRFEAILDEAEATNFDFCLMRCSGGRVGVEVKLSEGSFGPARNDERHRRKRAEIYAPRLQGKVQPDALTDKVFFPNYQILRNLSYADRIAGHHTVFLLPRENEGLRRCLTEFLDRFLLPPIRTFVTVAYAEDVVDSLRLASTLPVEMRSHYEAVAAKYKLISRIASGASAERPDAAV
jgi:hypothetical protein